MINLLIAGLIGFILGSFATFSIMAFCALARLDEIFEHGEDGHGED